MKEFALSGRVSDYCGYADQIEFSYYESMKNRKQWEAVVENSKTHNV